MTVDVQSVNFGSSQALFAHAERRIQSSLERFSRRIRRVSIRLWDENGPKGGRDMRCRVHVSLGPYGEVFIEQHDADMYAAIDRAADRVKRTVRRTLNKRRDRH